ncbi:E3 ubiquitin-protein ligase NRDP1-like [Drosophila innubila]|uniref:E3 ubiquitin-protein ligase NRDP1-like n=1 Tax=Drosophila innubila TaxID=198719 RepID=UPI00148E7F95|nr:E3 ubiquitin-protein ligase NRDP1-like [Drosophila innubila]
MGYQSLIIGHMDEDLLCPNCADVLEEPMQSSSCEHTICLHCLQKWMQKNDICPMDRSDLSRHLANRTMRDTFLFIIVSVKDTVHMIKSY